MFAGFRARVSGLEGRFEEGPEVRIYDRATVSLAGYMSRSSFGHIDVSTLGVYFPRLRRV